MMHPLIGIGAVLAVLIALMIILRLIQHTTRAHPELIRKTLHIGIGLVTLTFPWVFDEVWPVLVLSGVSIATMLLLRVPGLLRDNLGQVVSGVQRDSLGEVYYPVSVGVLFALTPNEPIMFVVPMLLLTLADAAAALVGRFYGRWQYTTLEGTKSWEGSLIFFLVSFFGAAGPLALFAETDPISTVLIGTIVGLLVMLVEAISWRGLDNLFIPLGTLAFLRVYIDAEPSDLVPRLIVALALVALVLFWRRRTTLNDAAALGAALFGYAAWTLADWTWLIAPLIVFFAYTRLSPITARNSFRVHSIHAVISVTSGGLICLFLNRTMPGLLTTIEYRYLYTLFFAAQLGVIGIARLAHDYPKVSLSTLILICAMKAWALIFVPYALVRRTMPDLAIEAAAGFGVVVLAVATFVIVQPRIRQCPLDFPRWVRQGALPSAAALFGLLPIFLATE